MKNQLFTFSLLSLDSDSAMIEKRSSLEETVKYTIDKNKVISLSPKISLTNAEYYIKKIILIIYNEITYDTDYEEINNIIDVYTLSQKIFSFWSNDIIQIKNQESKIKMDTFTAYNKSDFETLYNNLDEKDENYSKIYKIKEKLEGKPFYIEYNTKIINKLNELFEKYPNFDSLKERIVPKKNLLSIKKDKSINFPNILIYGDAGCGKSSLIISLCELYEFYSRNSMGSGSVNFTLTGNDKGFSKSDCGCIIKSMFSRGKGPIMNPLIILDEIDKANFSNREDSDFSGVFAELLEKNNAKHFKDNFFGVEVDASHINYIAIANDISKIPDYILSRFPVKLKIRQYTPKEIKTVVLDNIYEQWIEDNNFDEDLLPKYIPDSTRELISECCNNQPRNIPAILSQIANYTYKEYNGKSYIDFLTTKSIADKIRNLFNNNGETQKNPIGFKM
ncbi:MAG: AAA family ATPase [Treponema sp.]|nr:AAA family ATPase [Treponema sp.]